MIDTHTHIYSEEFNDDIDSVIQRAKNSGIRKALLPNIDTESIKPLNALADAYPGFCLPMMGLHPCNVTKDWAIQLNIIKDAFTQHPYIGVGEIGLDFYWDTSYEAEQILAFKDQLAWSAELKLPVSIHSRNSIPQTIKCIKKVGESRLRGVFHSFTGSDDELRAIANMDNFMIGINGVVTFKNSSLPITLKNVIGLSSIVVETDAPYLSPVPYRGKRNEPSYIIEVIEKLAQIYNSTPETVAEITTENAKKMFCLD